MFGKSIELFKIRDLSVRIDTSWVFLAVLITWSLARSYFPWAYSGHSRGAYWLMGLAGSFGLFASILLHELSHSGIARRQGIPVRSITLFIFGGVAEIQQDEPRSPTNEIQMALAGPAISVLLALVFYSLGTFSHGIWPQSLLAVLDYLSVINLVLAVFNLLPAFPLDGGRVLRAAIWHLKGDFDRSTRIAAAIGSGFGLLLAALGIVTLFFGGFVSGIWWILIGMFLRDAAAMSYQQSLAGKILRGEPIRRFMKTDVVTVRADETVDQVMRAYVYWDHHKFLPVTDANRLLGCLNISDIRRFPEQDWSHVNVADVMQPRSDSNTVAPEADAHEVISLMKRTGNSRMAVAKGEQLLGVVSLRDLLRFIASKVELETYGRRAA